MGRSFNMRASAPAVPCAAAPHPVPGPHVRPHNCSVDVIIRRSLNQSVSAPEVRWTATPHPMGGAPERPANRGHDVIIGWSLDARARATAGAVAKPTTSTAESVVATM